MMFILEEKEMKGMFKGCISGKLKGFACNVLNMK